jgi:hypothetical protein
VIFPFKRNQNVAMSHPEHLLLDSAIRDWVVFPMLIMLLLVGMGRHYVQTVIKSVPTFTEKDVAEQRYKNTCTQSSALRQNGNALNDQAFDMRKSFMIRKKTGILREKNLPGPANPMSNPMAMMDMMKGNMSYMIPNFAMMSFVSYFFSGFVCLKMPFSLPSTHFKIMMQRGVDLSQLDVSYVSSLALYFLLMFGLNDVYSLILGEGSEMDEQRKMQMQMGMGMMGNQAGFDAGFETHVLVYTYTFYVHL